MRKIKEKNLYLVLSEECGCGRNALDIAKSAIAGGIDMLQMREKAKPRSELLSLGHELCGLCKKNNVKFIVNDDPVLAKEIGADGVHLGQEDLKKYSIKKTRNLLGQDKIMGLSTHSLEQFKEANTKDLDYIAFGPIFPTKTKDYFIGTGDVEEVLNIAAKSVVFIGGINNGNIGELLKKGARNIAVIRTILEADDIKAKTEEIKRWLLK